MLGPHSCSDVGCLEKVDRPPRDMYTRTTSSEEFLNFINYRECGKRVLPTIDHAANYVIHLLMGKFRCAPHSNFYAFHLVFVSRIPPDSSKD